MEQEKWLTMPENSNVLFQLIDQTGDLWRKNTNNKKKKKKKKKEITRKPVAEKSCRTRNIEIISEWLAKKDKVWKLEVKKKEGLSENFEINKDLIQYFNADLEVKVIKKLFEEYTKHFEAESEGADSPDGILDKLISIISSVEEEFCIISDKKILIRSLTKLITILVSGN